MTAEFSVLIVHYETPNLLRECLQSIFSKTSRSVLFRVIVIDNASRGNELSKIDKEFSDVTFVFNKINVGFAAACNQGIRLSNEPYILLLNPDTRVDCLDLEKLVSFMQQNAQIGVCGPRLVYPNGQLQLSCRRFPTLLALILRISRLDLLFPKPSRAYLMAEWDHESLREVDWVIGGTMLLRRSALDEVDLLDEHFFMYYEDTDLCYRLKEKGWKVVYNPEVSVIHHHRRQGARILPNYLSFIQAKSLWYLYQKHRFAWF